MEGVNFAQQNSGHQDDRHRTHRDAIEYTSGKPNVPMEPPHPVPHAQQEPSVQADAVAPQKRAEKKPSFFSWRRKRTEQTTPVSATASTSRASLVSSVSAEVMHAAPAHHRESIVPDLLTSQRSHLPPSVPDEPIHQKELSSIPPTAPLSLDVNFIPDDILEEFATHNRVRDLLYTGIGVVVLVLFAYGGFNLYQQQLAADTSEIVAQSAELDAQIARYTPAQQEAAALHDQLTQLEAVLAQHTYWTPIFNRIEQLTLPTVYYTAMAGSASTGTFTFDVIAQDYYQMDAQVRVFKQDPAIRSVESTSAHALDLATTIAATDTAITSAESSVISFSMTVQFDPSIFQFSLLPLLQ